jgi:hypothetical protein
MDFQLIAEHVESLWPALPTALYFGFRATSQTAGKFGKHPGLSCLSAVLSFRLTGFSAVDARRMAAKSVYGEGIVLASEPPTPISSGA